MKLKLMMGLASMVLAGGTFLIMTTAQTVHAQATGSAPQGKKPGLDQAAPAPANAAVERGRYIATASDCVACHTAHGSKTPFAGGYALETPFGNILASNITTDKDTGIGNWTEGEFARAVRQGKGRHGENLYPAMPYTAYVKMTDADMHDLWAYMQTVKPVRNKVESNQFESACRSRLAGSIRDQACC